MQEAQQHWLDVGIALRNVGAEMVATGWHEGGYYYVQFAAVADAMPKCLEVLKKMKYKGTTGRKRDFKVTRGDAAGARTRSHLNTEGFLKTNGRLD